VVVTTSETSTRTGYRSNLEALLRAQKPSRGTAAYSRIVNRPAARRVAALAHEAGITPNTATAISAAFSAAGLVLLAVARPSWLVGAAVATLLALGFMMDSVDGQLARLRNGGSAAGEWLDHNIDCVKTCALHLAVLISWYRFPPVDSPASLLLPLGFQVIDLVVFFGFVMMPLIRRVHDQRPAQDPAQDPAQSAPEHPLRTWLILPTDYGAFCWMFVLLGWPAGFFTAYALMFAINAAVLPLVLRKWWRELRSFDLVEA
jgi:phosphatidylglycerophosphate synthase